MPSKLAAAIRERRSGTRVVFVSGYADKELSETRTYSVSASKVTMKSSSKDPAGKTLNFSYTAG